MYLDDALFYVTLDDTVQNEELAEWAVAAIAGGVDIIEAVDPEQADILRPVCKTEDALLVLPVGVEPLDIAADGYIVVTPGVSVGLARGMAPENAFVGVRTMTLEETLLAVETGCDFLVYGGGTDVANVFAAVSSPGVPLYAGGANELHDVEETIKAGIFRIGVKAALLGGLVSVQERAGSISRWLGREI